MVFSFVHSFNKVIIIATILSSITIQIINHDLVRADAIVEATNMVATKGFSIIKKSIYQWGMSPLAFLAYLIIKCFMRKNCKFLFALGLDKKLLFGVVHVKFWF